jgi:hypothetical protein
MDGLFMRTEDPVFELLPPSINRFNDARHYIKVRLAGPLTHIAF